MSASDDRVEPRLVKGFRDVLPGEMLLRNRVVATARAVYERYGFSPLDTPAVEHLDVLLGKYGEQGAKEIFRFETPDGEAVGLRFDLTVPLARLVAQYADLPRPFRRYQVAAVWRGDKPGPGRFREFIQFDIDTVGTAQTAADVEIIAATREVLAALGVPGFAIKVSSRRLLDVLIAYAGLPPARAHDVFRVLDKLDKQGLEAVKLELTAGRTDASGDKIPGLGLDTAAVDRIERFVTLSGKGRAGTLAAVADLFAGVAGAEPATAELGRIHDQLAALGIGDDVVAFDPTLARGLAYYTGPIFEAFLPAAPEFGSVFGGGRYDGLVERFKGEAIPATGGSLGVDRLIAALLKLGVLTSRASTTDVFVAVLDPGLIAEYQAVAASLRSAGIATEIYLGEQRGLKKQLAYADRIAARVAILLGGDELARGEVTLKDLAEGKRQVVGMTGAREEYLGARVAQRAVPRADLVAAVREMLAAR
jgi:histidyl-tRNA synthetase